MQLRSISCRPHVESIDNQRGWRSADLAIQRGDTSAVSSSFQHGPVVAVLWSGASIDCQAYVDFNKPGTWHHF